MNRMLALDMQTWLPDNLLIKADRMSMANSLELRVPFLDYTVVEYAATLPPHLKVRPPVKKYILKRILRNVLPSKILRRRKMGFPTPLAVMFRTDLSDYVKSILTDRITQQRGIFDVKRLSQLIHEHEAGVTDYHKILWQMLVLEEWFRKFVDYDSRIFR
jgi:asparagine synthase (glutamine-hydrolysing)